MIFLMFLSIFKQVDFYPEKAIVIVSAGAGFLFKYIFKLNTTKLTINI